ncbi:MAG: hypothetical protein IPH02_04570 [Sphingobacteriales bacterium]|nr:hypothetical protein [Sphingobacteriales bacterium]
MALGAGIAIFDFRPVLGLQSRKNWLLLRIWIVGLVMGHFVLETLMKAFSKQGLGLAWVILPGIIFIGIVLIAGSIIVKIAR